MCGVALAEGSGEGPGKFWIQIVKDTVGRKGVLVELHWESQSACGAGLSTRNGVDSFAF